MALLLNQGDEVSRSYSYTKPSPTHPIMPTFCGVRTGNLFDISTVEKGRIDNGTVGYANNTTNMTVSNGTVTFTTDVLYRGVCCGFIEIPSGADNLSFSGSFRSEQGIAKKFVFYDSQKAWMNADYIFSLAASSGTVAIPSGAKYVRLSITSQSIGTAAISDIMLNLGPTALPYEPFGWAIEIEVT